MEKKVVSAIMLAVLLVMSMLTLAFNIQPAKAGGPIFIRGDGSVDPPTAPIKRDGDVYTFTDNVYDEIVVERSNIIIDGAGYTVQGTGTYYSKGICLDGTSNVTIQKTNIKGFHFGVYFNSTSHNVISGNNITNNKYGVEIRLSSNNNTICRNNVARNEYGIQLDALSSYNEIYGNDIVYNTWEGVLLDRCSNNKVYENNITNNEDGVGLGTTPGFGVPETSYNFIHENNITTNRGDGISLGGHSSNNMIHKNNVTNNGGGVRISGSSNNEFYENNIANNSYAGIVLFWRSCENTIHRNNIVNNEYGIRLSGYVGVTYKECPENNAIYGNDVANNTKAGVELGGAITPGGALNNIFHHNNFLGNTPQVHLVSSYTNIWDDGYPSGGNYWSDYTGVDANGDDVGDTPYVIDENNTDRYPLMNPWISSEYEPIPGVQVGVKAGDWIKCEYTVTGWPSGTPYPEWLKVEILSVEATTAIVQVTMHMSDGTEQSDTVSVDVVAGGETFDTLFGFVIPANCSTGDSITMGGDGFTFTATIDGETTRTYAGASRTVVYASFSQYGTQLTYYWDKQTGIMVEASTTSGEMTATAKTTETNMWEAAPFWMQWWLWAIVAVVIVASAGAVYLKKRKPPTTPLPPPESTEQSE